MNTIMTLKSKRLRLAIVAFLVNTVLFAVGMKHATDLSDLGMGLMLVNGPLYAYVLGESYRPSLNTKDEA